MSDHFILTVDVEDWFQVENFKQYIPFSSWSSHELRVEKNTHRILDLLDSTKTSAFIPLERKTDLTGEGNEQQFPDNQSSIENREPGYQGNPKATFFILGWIADRLPHLVREIHGRGHEVASHGYYHNLCGKESRKDLEKDLGDSKKLLEDIIGCDVFGYRAPSFSISDDVLKIIEYCGYLYDSSYNSFDTHGRYGRANISGDGKAGITTQVSEGFHELPISNLKVGTHILPWGGGGYFRLLPFSLFKKGVETILKNENAYMFYMHPWEIDPEQPKVDGVRMFFRFRHYTNLDKTHSKLIRLIRNFKHCSFSTCWQYINEMRS